MLITDLKFEGYIRRQEADILKASNNEGRELPVNIDYTAIPGLRIEARPTQGDDRIGITGAFCAIAETGTVVLLSAADAPTASALLPDTHVAIVHVRRIVDGMEDAFARIRDERGVLPRAVNLISGPSRTGDIEQTIVLGAHGPFRVHVLVVDR